MFLISPTDHEFLVSFQIPFLLRDRLRRSTPSCFVPPANRFKRQIRPNQIYLFQSNSFIFTNSFSRALWSPSGELRRRFDQFNHKMIRFHLYGSMYHVSATVIYSQRRAWVILITGHLTKYLNLAVDLFYRAVNSIFWTLWANSTISVMSWNAVNYKVP